VKASDVLSTHLFAGLQTVILPKIKMIICQ
jgi:hypothetical protein